MELEQKIVEYLQKTESLIAEEAPAFVQEAINFYFYKELTYLCVSGLVLLVLVSLFIFSWTEKFKKIVYEIDNHAPPEALSLICSMFTIVISGFISSICIYHFIAFVQVCVAPKLYLVEKFMG